MVVMAIPNSAVLHCLRGLAALSATDHSASESGHGSSEAVGSRILQRSVHVAVAARNSGFQILQVHPAGNIQTFAYLPSLWACTGTESLGAMLELPEGEFGSGRYFYLTTRIAEHEGTGLLAGNSLPFGPSFARLLTTPTA